MTDTVNDTLPAAALPLAQSGHHFDFLRGIRVLDLTTSVAGPYAAQLLGDMGADVIKVERHHGDDARAWGPPFLDGESLWFLSVNRNKQSVRLDYANPEGLEVLKALVAKADVLILNAPSRVAKKLGIDYASLQAINSRLVYASITGFGIQGERADWPCYDLIAEGYSGVMDLTGEISDEPQKVGTPAADMLAGQDAAFATLSALFKRHTTGKGALVDIALVDSMTRFLTCRIVPYLGSGEVPRRSGGKDSVIAIYQAFETADEPITLGLGNDNIWKRFWEVLNRPQMIEDAQYASNADRRDLRAHIVTTIQEILITQPREHWLALFREARIPSGPINRVDEVVTDETMLERGLFYNIQKGNRRIPQVGTAMRIDGQSNYPRRPPPDLGEHTETILIDLLGYEPLQLDALRANGVI
ncbi:MULTISPECIES: CaiB/BaiF CoA transferase family protein [Pseudomonas]|uniref:CaiB/BaiF CoA transferase family protein n=1 Tax=Pseudomonas TaxID=286 RepID=UPI0039900203